MLKKETPPEQHPLVAKHMTERLELTLKIIDAELEPAMKKPFSKEQFQEFLEKAFQNWKRHLSRFNKRPEDPTAIFKQNRVEEIIEAFSATNLSATTTNKYVRIIGEDFSITVSTNRFSKSPQSPKLDTIWWAFTSLSGAMRSVDVEPDEPLRREIKRREIERYGGQFDSEPVSRLIEIQKERMKSTPTKYND